MEKRIKNHEQYSITDTGEVFSYKYRTPKKYDLVNIQNILTGAIGILGIGSLISLFIKHK